MKPLKRVFFAFFKNNLTLNHADKYEKRKALFNRINVDNLVVGRSVGLSGEVLIPHLEMSGIIGNG